MSDLVFVKIGGAVATDKTQEKTLRSQVLGSLAGALQSAIEGGGVRLLVGHGGGSFGHFPAMQYEVKKGVHPQWGFDGFQITRGWMTELNGKIRAAFAAKKLRLFPVQPSSCLVTEEGRVQSFETGPLEVLLDRGRTPVVWGDAVLDRAWGFTIVSTETLLLHLSRRFRPARVVVLTDVEGVYARAADVDEEGARPLASLDETGFAALREELGRTSGVDVTGGMMEKVTKLLDLSRACPGTEVRIVNGFDGEAVRRAVRGEYEGGTVLRGPAPAGPGGGGAPA